MEEQLQKLMSMSLTCEGPEKLHKLLTNQFGKGNLQFAASRSQELGNAAFKEGNFEQAISCYDMAIAGKKDEAERAKIFSNRSACRLKLGDLEGALEDARNAIRSNRKFGKAWYRAAKCLFEMKKYSQAEKVFQMALKHAPSDFLLKKCLAEASALAKKERMLQRISVDYTRFQDIKDQFEIQQTGGNSSQESSSVIEFSDSLSADEKQNLQSLLAGDAIGTQASKDPEIPITTFYLQRVFNHPHTEVCTPAEELKTDGNEDDESYTNTQKEQKAAMEKNTHALCNYLNLRSELAAPQRLLDFLDYTELPQKWIFSAHTAFLGVLVGVLDEDLGPIVSIGCSLGTTAVGIAKRLRKGAGVEGLSDEKEKLQRFLEKNAGNSIVLCTGGSPRFQARLMEEMVFSNNEESLVKVTHAPFNEISLSHCNEGDELQQTIADIPSFPSLIIIDFDFFDESLLGRNILKHLINFKESVSSSASSSDAVAKRSFNVFPARAKVSVTAYDMSLSSSFDELSFAYAENSCWSPNFERMDVKGFKGAKQMTETCEVFEFRFDSIMNGDVENTPLTLKKVAAKALHTGRINALVLTFELFASSDSTAAFAGSSLSMASNDWKQAVQWVDAVCVQSIEKEVLIEASSSNSRIKLRILDEDTTSIPRREYIPMWHRQLMTDGPTLNAWKRTISKRVSSLLREAEKIQREKQLSHERLSKALKASEKPPIHTSLFSSDETRVKQNETGLSSHTHLIPNPPSSLGSGVSILNIGCGTGVYTMMAARAAGVFFASRLTAPRQPLNVWGVDPSSGSINCAKKLLLSNYELLVEDEIFRRERELGGCSWGGLEWKPLEALAYCPSAKEGEGGEAVVVGETGGVCNYGEGLVASLDGLNAGERGINGEMRGEEGVNASVCCEEVSATVDSQIEPSKEALVGGLQVGPSHTPQAPPSDPSHAPLSTPQVPPSDPPQAPPSQTSHSPPTHLPPPSNAHFPAASHSVDDASKRHLLKKRVKFCTRDARQLRLAENLRDSASDLAAAKFYGLPPGSDLRRSLPPPNPNDIVEDRFNLLIFSCFDVSLIGEGLLPLGVYAANALCRGGSRCSSIPFKARVCGRLVELRSNVAFEDGEEQADLRVNLDCWKAYRSYDEYRSVEFDELKGARFLSDTFEVLGQELNPKKLRNLKLSSKMEHQIDITCEGISNAVVMWFELQLDEEGEEVISTAPSASFDAEMLTYKEMSGGGASPSEQSSRNPLKIKSTSWSQGLFHLDDRVVSQGETLLLESQHTETDILFRYGRVTEDVCEKGAKKPPSKVRPTDEAWISLKQQARYMALEFAKFLYSNESASKSISRSAMEIAIDPGRYRDHFIDPQEAAWLALSFFM